MSVGTIGYLIKLPLKCNLRTLVIGHPFKDIDFSIDSSRVLGLTTVILKGTGPSHAHI